MRPPAAAPTSFARLFAWGGALLFFFSIAYFLFTYTTTFGVPAEGGDAARAVTWNVALFTIFAMHHSAFARLGVRERVARVVPPGLERSVYVWVASLLFIAVCALWQPVRGVAWQADGAALWTLRLLQAWGVWLTVRSAAVLDIRELAGLAFRRSEGLRPPGNGEPATAAGDVQASDPEFKTTGPYGWVRHPIYTGWFLLVFAASPMTMTRLVFAVVSGAYLLLAIPLEERALRAGSNGAYDRYARQVRSKLIPGIY